MSGETLVTPEDVRRVVALDDQPVLRNLLITQGYHDLSEMMRARTGGLGINWCTLGSWASKTAGQFIRNDEVPAAFRKLLDQGNFFGRLAEALDPLHLLHLVERIIGDVSGNIMTGNRVVFAELAGACADFMVELGGDTSPDADRLRRFQERFTDGPPEPDHAVWDDAHKVQIATQKGGQGELRAMVAAYYAAMFETDAKKRAELLLLGNAHGGIHEQTRLQTYIAGSLDAPIADTLLTESHTRVDAAISHATGRAAAHVLLDQVLPAIARKVEHAWEELATVALMTLTLPDGVIRLGSPLTSEAGHPLVPENLTTISNPDLHAVLAKYHALEIYDHGASDWVDLDQRMRFILLLFRSRAVDEHLFAEPFTAAQREAIRAGRIPPGPL